MVDKSATARHAAVTVKSPKGRKATFSNTGPAAFILGPCALESADHAMMMANALKDIADRVTVLHQGKVLAEGRMEAVQSNPKVIEVYLGH